MGLFFGKKKQIAKRNDLKEQLIKEHTELQERLQRHDAIILKKNEAERRYEENGDLQEYLDFYRNLIKDVSCFEIKGSWLFRYPETLIKQKMYDEAWGVLNLMYLRMPEQQGRITSLQNKILKEEGRLKK